MTRRISLLLAVLSVLWLTACGSGGGSNMPTITSVSVSCSPSTVTSGGTSQCSATVSGTGSFSTSVTWSVSAPTGSAGSISSSGLYTAPTVDATLLVTVTATSMQDSTKMGTATITVNPNTAMSNSQPLVVDQGPAGATGVVNIAYITIQVCVPGSTTQCQTIDHVQVDTGSSGLRLLSSVLTIPLPAENDSSGNPLSECQIFLDGYIWGSVQTADVYIAGEKAGSIPVQLANGNTAPTSCSGQTTGGNDGASVGALGANGLIGVGFFQQDCGGYCVTQGANCITSGNQCVYYSCPPAGCIPANASIAQQLPNPVTVFASDSNGVLIQLPTVPDGGSSTVTGSLIFGIGTQSNNALGSATIYQVPDTGNTAGNIITTFNGHSYNQSFVDSGSNGIFFLDTATTGMPLCTGQNSNWYCPTSSPDSFSATNQGQNASGPTGSAVAVNFSIENANNLFPSGHAAYSTSGGPQSGTFDWGLSFFFGKNVFVAIDGANTPGGAGPYVAY
jgi:hypothetical protein